MSKIEWTEKTWNVSTGCNKVSEGCKHCYAAVMHPRQMVLNPEKYAHPFLDGAFPHEASLEVPLHWKKPAMIFVNSMSDLFHENIPFRFILKVFAIMALSPQHTFQILTKRPERALSFYNYIHNPDAHRNAKEKIQKFAYPYRLNYDSFEFPLKNVWIGTSVENQEQADKRIPYLLQIPAAVRFLSCEPLLGEVDLSNFFISWKDIPDEFARKFASLVPHKHQSIHWVIVGGESGHGARPLHPDWARKIRDDCQSAGVAFFFKQWGEYIPAMQVEAGFSEVHAPSLKKLVRVDERMFYKLGKKHTGRLLDGVEYSEYPNINKGISNNG